MQTVALLGPLGLLSAGAWSRRWVAEDGFIFLRVVDHLLGGHGPVFNVGERVEAATGPLWVVLLALVGAVLRRVPLEWIAVIMGGAASVAGLAFAELAGLRLADERPRPLRPSGRPERTATPGEMPFVVPIGALVVAALPVVWDFATSGMEMGLVFCWLGLSTWGLCGLATVRPDGGPNAAGHVGAWIAFVVGLGPLIRPDLALFSATFLAALLVISVGAGWRHHIRTLAAAALLPVLYQLFRMGYYALPVPNTALAKEASTLRMDQGLVYLRDLLGAYWLGLPLVAVVAALAIQVARAAGEGDRARLAAVLAPVVGGAAHAGYVVAIGGDYMRGRLLLPALFALAAPVSLVAVRRRVVPAAAATVAVGWALVAALVLRPPMTTPTRTIGDERAGWTTRLRRAHPILPRDYAGLDPPLYEPALDLRTQATAGTRLLLLGPLILPLNAEIDGGAAGLSNTIGVFGRAAGPRAHVVDVLGISEPIAAHHALEGRRGVPGHEKFLGAGWVLARYAAPGSLPPDPPLAAARQALGCGDLRELLAAVSDPLTPRRFLRNVGLSWRMYRLRIPPDPADAAEQLCAVEPRAAE